MRADGVDDIEFFEVGSGVCAVETAAAGVAFGLSAGFGDPFEAGLDELAVGGRLALHKVLVDDETVGLFGKVEAVAELGFRIGLAPYKDAGGGVVEAEDFLFIGNAA